MAALTHLAATGRTAPPGQLLVGARYPHQRLLAADLGATAALPPDQLPRAVRRRSSSLALGAPTRDGQRLTGGADVVLDCVGSSESIGQALDMVRPRGRVVLIGMPAKVRVDLASALAPRGPRWSAPTPTASSRSAARSPLRTFDLALEVVPPWAPDAWCPPPTRWSDSKRRWPTPVRPAVEAP